MSETLEFQNLNNCFEIKKLTSLDMERSKL